MQSSKGAGNPSEHLGQAIDQLGHHQYIQSEASEILDIQDKFFVWLRTNFLIALNMEMCEVIAEKATEFYGKKA